jgi:hypothetical protein
MTKNRTLLLVIALAFGSYLCVRVAHRLHREITYSRSLKAYSEVLKPGMSRAEVESFLKAKEPHGQIARIGGLGGDMMADLIQIAEEEPRWPCMRRNIHVAFEFASTEPHDELSFAQDSDRLIRISLFRSVCLDLP